MTKDEFQAWRAHPVTQIVDQYARDLLKETRGQWAKGADWTELALNQVQFLEESLLLSWEHIESFYEDNEADEQGDEHESDGNAGY